MPTDALSKSISLISTGAWIIIRNGRWTKRTKQARSTNRLSNKFLFALTLRTITVKIHIFPERWKLIKTNVTYCLYIYLLCGAQNTWATTKINIILATMLDNFVDFMTRYCWNAGSSPKSNWIHWIHITRLPFKVRLNTRYDLADVCGITENGVFPLRIFFPPVSPSVALSNPTPFSCILSLFHQWKPNLQKWPLLSLFADINTPLAFISFEFQSF